MILHALNEVRLHAPYERDEGGSEFSPVVIATTIPELVRAMYNRRGGLDNYELQRIRWTITLDDDDQQRLTSYWKTARDRINERARLQREITDARIELGIQKRVLKDTEAALSHLDTTRPDLAMVLARLQTRIEDQERVINDLEQAWSANMAEARA